MRFIHSYWTKPSKGIEMFRIWAFALSCSLIKSFGHEIVLHTDSKGKELLGHLPYDHIFLTLDKHDYDPHFWASGKIVAQQQEEPDTIHIDDDIFIFRKGVFNLLAVNVPVLTFLREYHYGMDQSFLSELKNFELTYMKDIPMFGEFCKYWDNTSVIRILDKKLRDEYLSGYHKIYNSVKKAHEAPVVCYPTVDVLLEQSYLSRLALRDNIYISHVQPKQTIRDYISLRPPIMHNTGNKLIQWVEESEILKDINIDVYNSTKRLSDYLFKSQQAII